MLKLNKLYLLDCMEGMKQFPDKYFDLAIVDPPYGINFAKTHTGKGWTVRENKEWDSSIPPAEYFKELFRISKDQIICGGNYMVDHIPPSQGWVFWDKGQRNFSLADGELIFTSFDRALRVFTMPRGKHKAQDDKEGGRIHPTQKPVQLYKWILHNYAKPDMKIIDTHVGSGSSIIAFLDFGCEWIGFEIDEDYHKAASERIEIHKKRPKPFFTDVELADKNIKQKGFFDDNKP